MIRISQVFLIGVMLLVLLLPSAAEAREVRTFRWSGETWTVRHTYGPSNPGHNIFSDSSHAVWVDSKKHLVLNIYKGHAVEVYGSHRNFGTFTWNVASNLSNLDAWRVIGLFAWAPDGNEQDIEFAHWGVPFSPVGWTVGWANGMRTGFTNFNVTPYAPYTVRLSFGMESVHYSMTDAHGTVLVDVTYAQPFPAGLGKFGFQPRMSHWLWPGVRGMRLSKQHRRGFHPLLRINSFRFTPMIKSP